MTPSRTARAILSAIAGRNGAYIAGDIEEEYFDRMSQYPQRELTRWYWSQFFRSLAPLLTARIRRSNAPRVFAGIILGCGVMGLWAAALTAAGLTIVTQLDDAQSSSVLIQSALLAKKTSGMILAGAAIGFFIAPQKQSKLISAPVIAFATYLLALGLFYSSTGHSALSLFALLIWVLSVIPAIAAGVMGGTFLRRRIGDPQRLAQRK